MSPLLFPLKTLPGFPYAPDPAPLQILIVIGVIPGLIAVLIVGLGMGRRWLDRDAAAHAAAVPDPRPELQPTDEELLAARREIVHQAALAHENRGDRPMVVGKTDPESYHP
jgi:predicted NUDIX family NTP pyrophosphohydrolase